MDAPPSRPSQTRPETKPVGITPAEAIPWWRERGVRSSLGFWGGLFLMAVYILCVREEELPFPQSQGPLGYYFVFRDMRLEDRSRDAVTFVNAREAEYDPMKAQVRMVAPIVIINGTEGEEICRAIAGSGLADVPDVTELFPSTLGDIRLATDVRIHYEESGQPRVLSTSGEVSFFPDYRVLICRDRTRVESPGGSSASFKEGFLLELTQAGRHLTTGKSVEERLQDIQSDKDAKQKKRSRE